MPKPILVFDVNETLLDLNALDALFEQRLGAASLRRPWFTELLQSAMIAALTDAYAPFSTLAEQALQLVAGRHDRIHASGDMTAIVAAMKQLPTHEDVPPAFAQLHAAGFRMVALTNGTPAMAKAQLTHAGLDGYLEQRFSVAAVEAFKPAVAPYHHVAHALEVPASSLCMIAAHDWDIAGAKNAGLQGAFIARPGMPYRTFLPAPDFAGPTLLDVASQLLNTYA